MKMVLLAWIFRHKKKLYRIDECEEKEETMVFEYIEHGTKNAEYGQKVVVFDNRERANG